MIKILSISPLTRAWTGVLMIVFLTGLFLYAVNAYAAVTVTFSATPTSTSSGGSVVLQWNARLSGEGDTPTCTGTGFATGGARSGSVTVNPTVTTTYTVNCDGVVKNATVTVSNNPPSASLSANPTTVIYGNATTLTWSSSNTTSCASISNTVTGDTYATGGATSGSLSITPIMPNNNYSINCTGPGGSAGAQVNVTVQQPPSITMAGNPSTVQPGNSASIAWNTTNATSCTGTNFSTGGALSGSATVSPTQTTTYTLTCQGNLGSSASQSVVIGVSEPPIGVSCSVNPSPANVNQSVTWFASAWGGTSPYSFSWIGDMLSSFSGSSVQATYDSAGSKNAIVEVTDSYTGSGSWSSSTYDNHKCTGPEIDGDSFTQDGGTVNNQVGVAKSFARSKINDPNFGPADFHANPQNYCVQAHVGQTCNPNGGGFGSGSCPFGVEMSLHSGSGRRATNSSDYQTVNGWTIDKYWGVIAYGAQNQTGRKVSYQCPVLTVNASAPVATLSANPISVAADQTSTLTYGCTNSTSASIDNGVGTVDPNAVAPSNTRPVTPGVTTLYTLTCTGTGGTATASVTVSVTAAQADLTANDASPVTVTPGSSFTFSGTSRNIGAGPSGGTGFSSALQICKTASNCTTLQDTGNNHWYNGQLASSGSTQTSVSVSIPSSWAMADTETDLAQATPWWKKALRHLPGVTNKAHAQSSNYAYYRWCANWSVTDESNGSVWTMTVPQSDVTNDCGAWAPISLATAALSCNVSPSSLPATGGTVTYTASPVGLAPYSWNDSMGGSYGSTRTVTRSIPGTVGIYAMSVSKSGYASGICPSITIGTPSCGTANVSITASPDRVREGQTSTISWTASGVDSSCTITGPGVNQSVVGASCVIPNGSATPTINAQSVYTISCDGGETTAQAVVNLIPKFIEF